MNFRPIVIVSGEPQSIFIEILLKTLIKLKLENIEQPIILISSRDIIQKHFKKFKIKMKLNLIYKDLYNLKKNEINLINIPYNKFSFNKGITDNSNSFLSESFKVGLEIIKNNKCLGLINGPIQKNTFLKGKFSGVTEYLAKKNNCKDPVMLIFNENLSVCPLTTHLPISKVSKAIKKSTIIKKIKRIILFYKKFLKKNPKIAVTGLNPHCESYGAMNIEKAEIIPAIKHLKKNKYIVEGPFSADTIFLKDNIKKFDLVFGMYHDQVLGPMKSIFGFNAINITLGLPFLRITPDHGPNQVMLGKNISNPESLIKAINFLRKYAL